MAHKHLLHELLEEDQEPFQLNNFIADRRSQIKRQPGSTSRITALQVKKQKPIAQTSKSKRNNLYKQACFLSFHDSPDLRKSPLMDFPSPAKSPCKSPKKIFLPVPARTAAMLLEAAMRIQKQSSKPKAQSKIGGFGLFGSIFKKLSNPNKSLKIGDSVKESTGKCEKVRENGVGFLENSMNNEIGFSRSCSHSRRESTVWSESNEEKSLDLDTSSSCCGSEDSEEDFGFASLERESEDFLCEKPFCLSPLSPFRFALQRSPSSGHRTPEFCSPAPSPSRHIKEEREIHGAENTKKIIQSQEEEEEEEEKEQCSPVSVLDPLFDDGGDYEEDEDYDSQCAYAIVQRAKQQLLHKLSRFEKLAELDPIELEEFMAEGEEQEQEQEQEQDDEEEEATKRDHNIDRLIGEVLNRSMPNISKVSADTVRLVSDLLISEGMEKESREISGGETVVERVCGRLSSWKEVEFNTIDMMVELDIRREIDGWAKNPEEVREAATEIEVAIFGVLLDELSEELICSTGL